MKSIVFGKEIIMKKIKSKSTFSATLTALILGIFVLSMGPTDAAEKKMVKDPSTGEMVTAPEYGGTLTIAKGGGQSSDY